jgi:hypothetical protein
MLVIMLLSVSCNLFNQSGVGLASPEQSRKIMLDLFSYVPANILEEAPDGILGIETYYLDFDMMTSDLDLPKVKGTDEWKEKLPLVTSYQGQNLYVFPEKIDPYNFNSYTTLGWDIADVSQSLLLLKYDAAIIRGDFYLDAIDQALISQGYTAQKGLNFVVYAKTTEGYCYGISQEILLIAPSCADVNALMSQKKNTINNASEISHLQQLIAQTMNPHGFVLLSSGDLSSIQDSNELLLEAIPRLAEIDTYHFDWDYAMISYMKKDKDTQLDIFYTFPSEYDAQTNLPIVKDTLTKTTSLSYRNNTTWADLLTITSMEQNENLIHVTATTNRKALIESSFINRDYYGWLPVRRK